MAPCTDAQAAFLEDFQHRTIVRQNVGDQFREPGVPRDRNEMAQQCGADGLSLVLIDNSKREFGLSGLHDDIAPAADDRGPPSFLNDRDQRDMIDEVDIDEEMRFPCR